jgi:serine/threonine protein kinase
MIGSVIGSYRITRKLGEGGMGAVYLAEHTLIGRQAAIKVLLPSLSARQDIVNRFFNEARAATAIADPGIVQIFDFGYHTDGSAFIVMEFLDGEALDVRLQRQGRLHPVDALRISRQLAASLASAHGKGIVHRDLKPENVFLVRDGEVAGGERVKILDFGIAKLADDHPGKVKTHTGALMGTPVYMSPEQCRGAGDLDHRSDIYALGCVLFHLLVGRPPFDGEGIGEIIAQHLREAAPPPSTRAPGIPPEVDAVVLRCLEKAPEHRFPSMGDVAGAIGQVLQHIAPGSVSAQHVVPYAAGATPLPGAGSYPPGSYPPGSVPPTSRPGTAPSTTPTTLGSSAAAVTAAVPPARRGGWIAALALLVAGGAGAAFAFSRGDAAPAATPPPAAIADADITEVAVTPPDASVPDAGPPDAGPPEGTNDATPASTETTVTPADAATPSAEPRDRRDRRDRDRHRDRDRRGTPPPGADPDDLDGDGIPDRR